MRLFLQAEVLTIEVTRTIQLCFDRGGCRTRPRADRSWAYSQYQGQAVQKWNSPMDFMRQIAWTVVELGIDADQDGMWWPGFQISR